MSQIQYKAFKYVTSFANRAFERKQVTRIAVRRKMQKQDQKNSHSTADEIAALKEQFLRIKKDSEEFVIKAKHLSDTGMNEAKELLESAKSNWNSITKSLSEFSNLFSKSKAKPVVKKATSKKKGKLSIKRISK